jgi:hypothetical protein
VGCPRRGRAAAELKLTGAVGDDAPMVLGGEEKVEELQGGVGKLEVGSIEVGMDREGVLNGEQGAAAGGARRPECSGRNWRAAGGWGARAELGKAC